MATCLWLITCLSYAYHVFPLHRLHRLHSTWFSSMAKMGAEIEAQNAQALGQKQSCPSHASHHPLPHLITESQVTLVGSSCRTIEDVKRAEYTWLYSDYTWIILNYLNSEFLFERRTLNVELRSGCWRKYHTAYQDQMISPDPTGLKS